MKPVSESSWPELQEELTRKTVETMSEIAHKHSLGELTDAEVIASVNAVFDVTSGLIPWDVADLLYKIRQDIEAS